MTYAAARRFRAGAGRGSSLPAAFSCRTLLVETRSTYFAEHSQQVFISRMCVKNSTSGFLRSCRGNRPTRTPFISLGRLLSQTRAEQQTAPARTTR